MNWFMYTGEAKYSPSINKYITLYNVLTWWTKVLVSQRSYFDTNAKCYMPITPPYLQEI